MKIDEVRILGVKVNRVTIEVTSKLIEELISDNKKHQICVPNVWTIVLSQKDQEFREINNSSSLAIPDGMPLVWVSRLYGRPIQERISGTDLFLELAKVSTEKGYKFFFLGATSNVLKKMIEELKRKHPSLEIVGYYSPPFFKEFPEEENLRMIEIINRTKPDILWVGFTAPKQEKWINENLEKLNVRVAVGIGAAFDFIAGRMRRAPEWMQNMGLEWFYRLWKEPKRLWKRYLVGNTIFICLVAKEFLKIKLLKKYV